MTFKLKYFFQFSIRVNWNHITASSCGLSQTLQVISAVAVQLTRRVLQVEDIHRPSSGQGRQGSQHRLWLVGQVRTNHVDSMAGLVSEGHAQGSQEIPTRAAADGVNPGQS